VVKAQTWRPAGPNTVQITGVGGVEIVKVPQRDLYGKYGWPAKDVIVQRLQMYKEEMDP
jgi:hypothetical protein